MNNFFDNKLKIIKSEIAGVVVLYNPSIDNLKFNIESYISSLGKLYVVDNSTNVQDSSFISYLLSYENIVYIPLYQNYGIAKALNTGANSAIKEGFKWLFTIDQDSSATENLVMNLWDFASKGEVKNIGIVTAQPNSPTRVKMKNEGWEFKYSVFTSGNLVNLHAYQVIGGYENKLFIDYVDHIFNLSLNAAGYKIVQLNYAILLHNLGDSQVKYFLGIKMIPTNHNYIRKYYITRNRFYLYSKFFKIFPRFVCFDLFNQIKEIIKLLLFETDKLKKIHYMIKGFIDYKRNEFGKFNY